MTNSLWRRGMSLLINPDATLVYDDHCCCAGAYTCAGYADCFNCENSSHFTNLELSISGFEDGTFLSGGDPTVECFHSNLNGVFGLTYNCENHAFEYLAGTPCTPGEELPTGTRGLKFQTISFDDGSTTDFYVWKILTTPVCFDDGKVFIDGIGFVCQSVNRASGHCVTSLSCSPLEAGGACPPIVGELNFTQYGNFTPCSASEIIATGYGSKCVEGFPCGSTSADPVHSILAVRATLS